MCFCQGKHALVDCLRLKSEPQEKKVECLKRNGYCFEPFLIGHMSKDCKRKLDCQICQRKQPALLHIDSRSLKPEAPHNLVPMEPKGASINSALVSADKVTGAGKECALAIVPVQVEVAKGDKTLLTYAFLEPVSSATFCTENLTSSPSIANFALQQTGKDNSDKFSMDVLQLSGAFMWMIVSSRCLPSNRQSSLLMASWKHAPKEVLLSPSG